MVKNTILKIRITGNFLTDDRTQPRNEKPQVMSLAKRTVGLFPIGERHINYFREFGYDNAKAERLAVQEYLMHFLKMDEDEFEDLDIEHITIGRRLDTIYIRLSNVDQAKEIFQRGAQAHSKDFKLCFFVPPQVFDRYKAAQDMCASIRENGDREVTVRFGMLDILVLERNSNNEP